MSDLEQLQGDARLALNREAMRKGCPLNGMKPCIGTYCAWYDFELLAVRDYQGEPDGDGDPPIKRYEGRGRCAVLRNSR